MLSLRITAPDGSVRNIPLTGTGATIGRDGDNSIVLEGGGVSGHHCFIQVQGEQCTLHDRGSTNGTFINNTRGQTPTLIGDSDRLYIGQYLIEVLRGASLPGSGVSLPPATTPPSDVSMGSSGLLIQRGDRAWRDELGRLSRYADQWDNEGRPDRLALRPHELRRAEKWLAGTPPEQAAAITALHREFIAQSRAAGSRRMLRQGLLIALGVVLLGGLITGAVFLWPEGDDQTEADDAADDAKGKPKRPPRRPPEVVEVKTPPDGERVKIKQQIDHTVVPKEEIGDIAERYGVSVAKLAEWNTLNPDAPDLSPGDIIKVKKPTKRPLPQQRINYELEPEDTSWAKLAARFRVSAKKLRAYNPELEELKAGQEVVIWIDPKPYKPKQPRQPIPQYVPNQEAQSHGAPNAGTLVGGMQMPDSPLYKRRYPYIMWGSGYLVSNLQTAVAQFRQDMDFDGTLVLADISKKNGGHFPPHKSHQAGRDIDIWLPTLRGVFKEKYLTEDGDEKWGRRPNPEEADWFATWGLIRALIATNAVQAIFLDYSIQPNVYNAAKFLGIDDEELDRSIQWPRPKGSAAGVLSHSAAHIHHMHVRFKCARYEKNCQRRVSRGP